MTAKPWKIIVLLAGIFIAGGVTGAFVMLRVGREMVIRRNKPDQLAPQQLKRLIERLDLKPDQVELLRPIVRRNMDEIGRLRSYSIQETRTIYERMEREISEQLTPEQRTKFEQLNKEMHERARKFMPDGPNRGFGPGGPRPDREHPPGDAGKPADMPPPKPGDHGDQPPPPPPADKPPGGA